MVKIPEIFGSMVYNDAAMKKSLPKDIYTQLKHTIRRGEALDPTVADVVANAIKDWATERGATHFTHWFQPMTGITAEKHDSFISPIKGGGVIMEFSGKELLRGEPDASSFPSGSLRATFEARGYTAWDPTSYAFIKDHTLYIPTTFCSYGGEVLDKKTPLLRSMECLSKQALRILRLFGDTETSRVLTMVGAEQEYFIIDKELFLQRDDLRYCGRTLFGAKPPKGQELDDHYFGSIRPRVVAYMRELDEELWKLGITAKTEHNEVAPSQHELASIYTSTNIATDHNQLTMDMMKKVADRHNLACLLHEKPFTGVNGSGKHNNWSLSTDKGVNLFDPGSSPAHNARFLLFFCAVIKAVDEYADLLRVSVVTAGNDHRLGGNEAPPSIISMFVGEDLAEILEAIENNHDYRERVKEHFQTGVNVLPPFPKDATDRNRTSPFAFTGNKFEFRMLGSSLSIAGPNMALNTSVAESLCQFADVLEQSSNFHEAVSQLIHDTIVKHKRIIFNGDNYSEEWEREAGRRGLVNLKSGAEALPYFIHKKNVDLFTKHKIFTETEVHARHEIRAETYCKVIQIEAQTMLYMIKRQIIPAVSAYTKELAETLLAKKGLPIEVNCTVEERLITMLSSLSGCLYQNAEALESALIDTHMIKDPVELANYLYENVCLAMREARAVADELETLTADAYWPFPNYGQLLFSV